MNRLKEISLFGLFTLLAIATVANMTGSATATGDSTAGQEKMAIPNVQFISGAKDAEDIINVTIINMGYNLATITSCIVKDSDGNVITTIETDPSQPVIEKRNFKVITFTLKADTLVDGTQYSLTVATSAGSSFVSPSFNTSSNTEYDPFKDDHLQSMLQATPEPLAPYWSPFLNSIVIGSLIAAVISVVGAHKLSGYIMGSKNRKDRYILFIFISVILLSIIVWVVTAVWSPTIATM